MAMNCNLPSECDCELCQYWEENGWDVNRTPDWQRRKDNGEEDDE